MGFFKRIIMRIRGPRGCCCKTKPKKVQIDVAASVDDLTMTVIPIQTPITTDNISYCIIIIMKKYYSQNSGSQETRNWLLCLENLSI